MKRAAVESVYNYWRAVERDQSVGPLYSQHSPRTAFNEHKEKAMTFEETLARLVMNTGRIAAALEAIASAQGIVSDADIPDDQGQLDLEPKDEKPTGKKETVVGKQPKDKTKYGIKDVRAELHKLQEQENQAAVKSVLKKFGASTLGQVDKKKYGQLIKTIQKQLD